MSTTKSNKSAKQQLIKRYGPECFIEKLHIRKLPPNTRYYVSKKEWDRMNQLTYHHIKMRKDGGEATVENGALLKSYNHAWFHQQPKEVQDKLNQMFQEYKKRRDKELEVVYDDDVDVDIEDSVNLVAFAVDKKGKLHVYSRAKMKKETKEAIEEYYKDKER